MVMPPNVLYDVTFRNLTNEQVASVQDAIFSNVVFEREESNLRPVEVTINQHADQIDMWDLKFYHLKPSVALEVQGALFKNELYPVIIELKG